MPDHQNTFEFSEKQPEARPQTGEGIAWGLLFSLLAVALLVVFALQNTNAVPVKFLWMEGDFSLALVVLVTAGVAIVASEVVALVYRRRRRKRRAEKEELKKLRNESTRTD